MIRSAREEVSAWASVLATMKSTPTRPETIMLLTALPPAPPTPHTMMRGFSSLSSGALMLIVMCASLFRRPPAPFPCSHALGPPPRRGRPGFVSKTLLQPAPHPCDVAVVLVVAPRHRVLVRRVFEGGDLRVDHQADRGRESRAFGALRQALDAERPAHPRLRRY